MANKRTDEMGATLAPLKYVLTHLKTKPVIITFKRSGRTSK